jgi:peptidoglycan hydrolase CwlO-like protein
MYSTQKQLEEEKKRRHGEVEALQFSLDDVSRQMLNMGKKMHTLESDNESLRMELKRLRAEKEQTQRMRRSARGF